MTPTLAIATGASCMLNNQPRNTVFAADFRRSFSDVTGRHTPSLRGSSSWAAGVGVSGVSFANGVTVPDSTDWILSGDFTVEWWGSMTDSPSNTITLIDQWLTTGNQRAWTLSGFGPDSSFTATLSNDGVYPSSIADGDIIRSSAFRTDLASTTHVAMTRSGSTVRVFFDGVLKITRSVTIGGLNNSTTNVLIGAHAGTCYGARVINGSAKYVAAFTPPANIYG